MLIIIPIYKPWISGVPCYTLFEIYGYAVYFLSPSLLYTPKIKE
jgi:hypothetical protein